MDQQQDLLIAGLLIAVVGFALLSYTTGNAPLIADPSEAVSPRPFPEKPGTINATTAATFAAAYEEARLHNEILDEQDGVTRIDTMCTGAVTNRTAAGYHVSLDCSSAWELKQAGRTTLTDGDPYLIRYLITPDRTRQLMDRRYLRERNDTD